MISTASVTTEGAFIGWGVYRSLMPEDVLFKSESDRSREQIAAFLRKVAENLEGGDAITLKAGDDSVTLSPPSRPTFEVKANAPSCSTRRQTYAW